MPRNVRQHLMTDTLETTEMQQLLPVGKKVYLNNTENKTAIYVFNGSEEPRAPTFRKHCGSNLSSPLLTPPFLPLNPARGFGKVL